MHFGHIFSIGPSQTTFFTFFNWPYGRCFSFLNLKKHISGNNKVRLTQKDSQLGWWDLLLSIFRECRCTWPGSVRLGQSIWQRARQIEENNSCLLGSSFNTATPGVLRRGWASLSGSNKASNLRIVARLINYLDWNLIK